MALFDCLLNNVVKIDYWSVTAKKDQFGRCTCILNDYALTTYIVVGNIESSQFV